MYPTFPLYAQVVLLAGPLWDDVGGNMYSTHTSVLLIHMLYRGEQW